MWSTHNNTRIEKPRILIIYGHSRSGTTLLKIFPRASVVGDKLPVYYRQLSKFSSMEGLSCVVIYRDCRDVTLSYIKANDTIWQHHKRQDTVKEIAKGWVRAIKIMERHTGKVFIIRYEELLIKPQPVLEKLDNWLGVDPHKYNMKNIRPDNYAKYKNGLSEKEIEDFIEVAGPTMKLLGSF